MTYISWRGISITSQESGTDQRLVSVPQMNANAVLLQDNSVTEVTLKAPSQHDSINLGLHVTFEIVMAI